MKPSDSLKPKGTREPYGGRNTFQSAVLEKAELANANYAEWASKLSAPNDIEVFLDFSSPLRDGRTFDFDRFKNHFFIRKDGTLMLGIDQCQVSVGMVLVDKDFGETTQALNVRASLHPKHLVYTQRTTLEKPKDISEYKLEDLVNKLRDRKKFKDVRSDEAKQALIDITEIVYRGRVELLTKANQDQNVVTRNQQFKTNKRLEKLRNGPDAEGLIEVGLFPIYFTYLLDQLGLVTQMLNEWGEEITSKILDLALMIYQAYNYRPSLAEYREWCKHQVSLSRRPHDSRIYRHIWKLFRNDYLLSDKARAQNYSLSGQSVMHSYVMLNQRCFVNLLPKLKSPLIVGDGTSFHCSSKLLDLAKVGTYAATKELISNVKEYNFYEHQTGLILYQQYHDGDTNDFVKTSQALRSSLMKLLGKQVDPKEITVCGDRGTTSKDTVGQLIHQDYDFIMFSKNDNEGITKVLTKYIDQYVAEHGISPLIDSLPPPTDVRNTKANINHKSKFLDRTFSRPMAIEATAYELGYCTKTGLTKNSSSKTSKELNDYRIDPETKLLVTFLVSQDANKLQQDLLTAWKTTCETQAKINNCEEEPPVPIVTQTKQVRTTRTRTEKQKLFVPYTIDDLLKMRPEHALALGIEDYFDLVDRADLTWDRDTYLWMAKQGVTYRYAQKQDQVKIIGEDDDYWISAPFCYGISRQGFYSIPHKNVYKHLISRLRRGVSGNETYRNQEIHRLSNYAKKSILGYGGRMCIETNYRIDKRIDSRAVHMSSIETFAVRRVAAALARLAHHLIRNRFIEYAHFCGRFKDRDKTESIGFKKNSEIVAILGSHVIKVNYETGEYFFPEQLGDDIKISEQLKELLKILRLPELTPRLVGHYLPRFWSRPVRKNSITNLCSKELSESDADELDKSVVSIDYDSDDEDNIEFNVEEEEQAAEEFALEIGLEQTNRNVTSFAHLEQCEVLKEHKEHRTIMVPPEVAYVEALEAEKQAKKEAAKQERETKRLLQEAQKLSAEKSELLESSRQEHYELRKQRRMSKKALRAAVNQVVSGVENTYADS